MIWAKRRLSKGSWLKRLLLYTPKESRMAMGIASIPKSDESKNTSQSNVGTDLPLLDKSNRDSVKQCQEWLIANGYLTEADARGG